MSESEFLVDGHITEYYDIRELDVPTTDLIRRIRNKIRECEKYHIDYEEYIEKEYLKETLEVLTCCVQHKDNPKLKRVE